MHATRRGPALVLLLLGAWSLLAGAVQAQPEPGAVHVVDISGEIDLGIAPYLQRAIDDAAEADAAAVLLEIDTPGGRLDAVIQMRDTLLASPVPTIAYIDRTALSAGALIALASESIYVAPGASVGAATPVDGTGQPTDEKVVSSVRSLFRATAEERGRDPAIAAAMVDPNLEVEGVSAAGDLVTLTDREAIEVGFADGSASDRTELLEEVGLGDAEVVTTSASWAERLVRFLTNPILGSLLFSLGILLILGEVFAGGIGLATVIGGGLVATFFWGHLLAGLTGWEHVLLVGAGVALLLVELFVIPGFGVAGVLGAAGVLSGGFLAMTGRDWDLVPTAQIVTTAGTLVVTFILLSIALVVTLSFLSRRKNGSGGPPRRAAAVPPVGGTGQRRGWLRWFGDGDVLDSEDDDPPPSAEGEDPSAPPASVARKGAIGEALSDLRPAGVANFGGRRVDVVTEGDYIAAGQLVEVVHAERYRRVVRRAPE